MKTLSNLIAGICFVLLAVNSSAQSPSQAATPASTPSATPPAPVTDARTGVVISTIASQTEADLNGDRKPDVIYVLRDDPKQPLQANTLRVYLSSGTKYDKAIDATELWDALSLSSYQITVLPNKQGFTIQFEEPKLPSGSMQFRFEAGDLRLAGETRTAQLKKTAGGEVGLFECTEKIDWLAGVRTQQASGLDEKVIKSKVSKKRQLLVRDQLKFIPSYLTDFCK